MRSVVQPTTFNERKVEKANEGNRTPDRALTKRLLYRLSYVGVKCDYTKRFENVSRKQVLTCKSECECV